MSEERFSIGELAATAATTPRTIRFYTTEGLLPPPLTEGRNAIYSGIHRRRLRLIQRLKAAYLPLSTIKEQMAGLTDDQVEAILERSGPHRVENTGHAARPHGQTATPPASAVDYVERILAAASSTLGTPSEAEIGSRRILIVSPSLREDADSGAVGIVGHSDAPLESTPWERFELAEGVELHARHSAAAKRREEIRRIVAMARSLLRDASS